MNRETVHFIDAARWRGHDVVGLDATACSVMLSGEQGLSISAGADLALDPLPDVALARIPSLAADHVRDVVRQVEYLGVPCVNSASSLAANRDKSFSYAALAASALPIPMTCLVMPRADKAERQRSLDGIISLLPAPPWILKLPDGSKGQGVMIAESLPSLCSMLDAFGVQGHPVLVQQCMPEAMAANIRVLVFGGKAIAAVERHSRSGEFRANMAQGAQGHVLALNDELTALAEAAARVFGLGMTGIDMIKTATGYVILEVNSCPGFVGPQKNIDETTPHGIEPLSLASALLDHMESVAAQAHRPQIIISD